MNCPLWTGDFGECCPNGCILRPSLCGQMALWFRRPPIHELYSATSVQPLLQAHTRSDKGGPRHLICRSAYDYSSPDVINLPGCPRLTRLPGQKPSENFSKASPISSELSFEAHLDGHFTFYFEWIWKSAGSAWLGKFRNGVQDVQMTEMKLLWPLWPMADHVDNCR